MNNRIGWERREVRGEEGRQWKSLEKMVEMGNCRMRTGLAQLLPPVWACGPRPGCTSGLCKVPTVPTTGCAYDWCENWWHEGRFCFHLVTRRAWKNTLGEGTTEPITWCFLLEIERTLGMKFLSLCLLAHFWLDRFWRELPPNLTSYSSMLFRAKACPFSTKWDQ